jgi:hypothetical protein
MVKPEWFSSAQMQALNHALVMILTCSFRSALYQHTFGYARSAIMPVRTQIKLLAI